ncbi:MAG: leucine-rich repeat domain-containing protein [Kiritimatiellae bacterium]|nr:leucine-rich repeat domain-containing protein [Kiritimatiellia bacterium]
MKQMVLSVGRGLSFALMTTLLPLLARANDYFSTADDGVKYQYFLEGDFTTEHLASQSVVVYSCDDLATNITIPGQIHLVYYRRENGQTVYEETTFSVSYIRSGAFYGRTSLQSVVIENGITELPASLFYGCNGLKEVRIPSSVTLIGSSTFSGCSAMESLYVEDLAAWCRVQSSDSPWWSSGKAKLFINGQLAEDIVIPEGITTLHRHTFSGCASIKSVTLPNSITNIEQYAFSYCSGLTNVTIPGSVTSIGDFAFSGCSSLASVSVSQYVMERGLQDVFASSYGIRHLDMDTSVSSINEKSFALCKSLTTIEVDAENEHYFVSPMDGCLYDRDQTTLLCCPRDKTSITIPYGVTKIANYAFAYCSNLVSVSMPVTLTTIGENAFFDCTALPTVAIPESVTSIGNYAFGNCRNLHSVTIPGGVQGLSTSAFNNCASLWTEWYRALADFAVHGRAYDLTQRTGDRAIADVTVSGDTVLDSFVLKEGKVYDSVLYIKNNAGHAVRVSLPSGNTYQTFKGATPLTLPAYSTSILTITRVAGGNAGGNVFLVTREELENVQ